jgi:molybdopterin molybdotransferase
VAEKARVRSVAEHQALIAEPVRSPAGRRQFRRALLDDDGRTVRAARSGSPFLDWLATPGGMMDIPEQTEFLDPGAKAGVWVLE